MATQTEAALEESLINKLVEVGYERVKIKGENELKTNFKAQLEKFNKIELTDLEFNQIMIFLEGGTVFDKAKKLRDMYELQREDGTHYIRFLNRKDWCKNLFQVTNQVTLENLYKNRYDVTILINGLPLVQIELKKRGVELKEAFNQINRYHRHSYKGLFHFVQIFVISNGVNTRYYANNRDLSFKYTFKWKHRDNTDISSLDEFADTFLEKCHLSKMITKYIVLNDTEKALMVLRAYQYYAVELILDKALNTKQNGYVWHTTGSGKTLTSFKVSQILSEEDGIDKIIFVVDRKDLDYQTYREFNNFCEGSVDETEHTHSLIKQFLSSEISNKLIITTIQKLYKAVVTRTDDLESVKYKRIILMFDECHRSQFGSMHEKITKFFKNLQYFGFTGTPIFNINANKNRTTKSIFGDQIHSYVIKDAIRDNNVLGFSVEYYGKYTNMSKGDIDVENIDTKELIESEKVLEKIADFIIQNHDKKTYNREYNAIFAVSSIEVLSKYYEIFKRKDHDLKIATIFSYNDNEEIKGNEHSKEKLERYIGDYNKLFGTNFKLENFDQYYIDVAKKSKNRQIDILLVVNMFLTGFDSKYLNTLYVDKNLQYHGLVQAYSRTNRLLGEKKKQGNIVCFRNLKEATDEAIRLYSDKNALETVLMSSYDEYVDDFNNTLQKLFKLVPKVQDVDNLESEIEDKKFVEIFRDLLRLKTRLEVFTEFKFKDLEIDEQKFIDYQGKYLDLYERRKGPNKTSVLNDVDFEVELIGSDNINVAYIIHLLKDLDSSSPEFVSDKKAILDTMEREPELRSKIELIEQFIDQNMPNITSKEDIEGNFEIFIEKEKNNAIEKFVNEEKLEKNLTKGIIAEYEFSGKIKNDIVEDSFQEKMGLIERRSKLESIRNQIKELVDKFSW